MLIPFSPSLCYNGRMEDACPEFADSIDKSDPIFGSTIGEVTKSRFYVATSADEDRLLPAQVRKATVTAYLEHHLEPIWLVDSLTDQITGGSIVNTHDSTYFTFEVFQSDGGFDMIPTSDWKPCGEI